MRPRISPVLMGPGLFEKHRMLRPDLRVFLVLAAVFGLAFLVLTPPFQVPDEHVHFYRAYHVSQLKVTGNVLEGKLAGDVLPISLGETAWGLSEGIPFHPEKKQDVKKIFEAFKRPLKPEAVIFTDFRGALVYSPIAYLPQAARDSRRPGVRRPADSDALRGPARQSGGLDRPCLSRPPPHPGLPLDFSRRRPDAPIALPGGFAVGRRRSLTRCRFS